MGVDLRVAAEEASCRETAAKLATLDAGVEAVATNFHRARGESEAMWTGTAGEAFRSNMASAGKGSDDIAAGTRDAGRALGDFADDIATVRARLEHARGVATDAGLTVNGDIIEEPHNAVYPADFTGPPAPGMLTADHPDAAAAQADYQRKLAAYREAQTIASEARGIEKAAHDTLGQKMSTWQTVLNDASKQKWWQLAGAATGTIGSAIQQAGKWNLTAQTRYAQAATYAKILSEVDDPWHRAAATRAAGVFENSADDAARMARANANLAIGVKDTKLGDLLARNLVRSVDESSGAFAKLGSKVPVVGVVLAGGQTAIESWGKDADEWAKSAGANLGGAVVGSLATDAALATAASLGLAGGPATLVAVGVGTAVAFGVGELVNHWPEINEWSIDHAADQADPSTMAWLGRRAEDVGEAAGDAADWVGDRAGEFGRWAGNLF